MESPLHKQNSFLENEAGSNGIYEVVMHQRNVSDNKPVHAGVCILQHSKLMLLRFVNFLRKFLVKGSFALVYGGDYQFFLIHK